jgi:hypothetical protein
VILASDSFDDLFVPYSRELLASCADGACPCCCQTGVAHGFGLVGRLCPCVATCEFCGAPLPIGDECWDEGRPRTYEGLLACPWCRGAFAREDGPEARS